MLRHRALPLTGMAFLLVLVLAVPASATSLAVTNDAALTGTWGMEITFDGVSTSPSYVRDDTPSGETHFNFRYQFDPNSVTMVDNKRYKAFQGLRDAPQRRLVTVVYRKNLGQDYLLVKAHRDDNAWDKTPWLPIADGPVTLEVDWTKSTDANSEDGEMRVWLDGVLQSTLTGLDNSDGVIDHVRWGAVGGVDAGTVGPQYFDEYESFR